MASAFEEDSLGLKLKGYAIVPNEFLETKIGIYTPEIVESILTEHPGIMDKWLNRLYTEYISKKKQCDFENDPVACFTLSAYEQYDKNFRSWDDGGLIAITLPRGRVIRVSKKPLITIAAGAGSMICSKCMSSFTDFAKFEKHCREEEENKVPAKKKIVKSYENAAPNPIWWLAP
jgi:hypothetical protein